MSLRKHLKDKLRIVPNKAPRTYDHVPDEVETDDGVVMNGDLVGETWSMTSPLVTTRYYSTFTRSMNPFDFDPKVDHDVYHCPCCTPMNVDPSLDVGWRESQDREEIRARIENPPEA